MAKKLGQRGANIAAEGPWKYGRYWPGYTDLMVELACFRDGLTVEQGGLGKVGHFWAIINMLWPAGSPKEFVKHPWAEQMAEEACRWQYLSVSGCASSGKTDFFAVWNIVNWLADPLNTLCLVTSTTLKESRRRIWGSITDYWMALPVDYSEIGKLVDSFGKIVVNEDNTGIKASDRCGIILIPGEKSKEKEAIGKIIGSKNKRVFLTADELTELSPAIMNAAVSNLSANPFMQAVGLGNPASYYDAHGTFSEPKNDWDSITPKDFSWETKLGYAIRFDAELSPNVVAGEVVYPFLPTAEKLAASKQRLGENSFEFWRMWKGYWCPEGVENTIYSESEMEFFKTTSVDVEWARPPIPLAGLDAGYTNGGDRSIAYFGLLGQEQGGGDVLLYTGYELIKADPTVKDVPRNYQVARNYKKAAQSKGVKPSDAGLDVTGAQAFGDIVSREWSPDVLQVTFGGKSSKRVVGEDKVPADTRYSNRVTELWFGLRDYLKGFQIRGISKDFAKELTSRKYTTAKRGGEMIVEVERKKDMRTRTGFSPDIADAGLVLLEVAKSRHGFKVSAAPVVATRVRQAWSALKDKVAVTQRKSVSFRSLIREGRTRSSFGRGLRLLR